MNGKQFGKLIEENQLKQEQVALALGRTQAAISYLINNSKNVPKLYVRILRDRKLLNALLAEPP